MSSIQLGKKLSVCNFGIAEDYENDGADGENCRYANRTKNKVNELKTKKNNNKGNGGNK